MSNSRLFHINRKIPHPRLRLFCFPYAGGSATTFYSWSNHFKTDIELVFVNPPGRGPRIADSPHQSMASLVEELMEYAEFITSVPYVFFGHSVGSRVAFELSYQLKLNGLKLPEHFIASGSRAPHMPNKITHVHGLPNADFIDEVRKLNGTPDEFFEHAEILELLLPTLRADFKISETYQAKQIEMPFSLTVLNGKDDTSVEKGLLNKWAELTDKNSEVLHLPGDHFFIDQHRELVIDKVIEIIDTKVSV